jgi:hypothetical protein
MDVKWSKGVRISGNRGEDTGDLEWLNFTFSLGSVGCGLSSFIADGDNKKALLIAAGVLYGC